LTLTRPHTKKWMIISLLIVFIVTLTPGDGKIAGDYLDKVVHFLIFFLLSVSISHAYLDSKKLNTLLLSSMILGFLTEILQQYIPGRNLEFNDALADCLGVLLGYIFYCRFKNKVDRLLD